MDRMRWCHKSKGQFDTQSFNQVIWVATKSPFPWKGIWSVKVPKRVVFFMQTAALGWILTLDHLMRRGLPLVNWCCMCWSNGESMDHLLLHCNGVQTLWGDVFQIFGIHWVMLGTVAALLFCQRNWFGRHDSVIWNMVPGCLMWIVWKEWNRHQFEGNMISLDQSKSVFQHTL